MKSSALIGLIVMPFAFVMPATSEAAVANARTIMRFDANENLIGQSVLYRSNDAEHQGVTSGPTCVTISCACETR